MVYEGTEVGQIRNDAIRVKSLGDVLADMILLYLSFGLFPWRGGDTGLFLSDFPKVL